MEHVTVPGRSYAVTSEQDCTLTAANGWKLELTAGIQQHFTAQFESFTASAPITLTVNFNSAPAGSAAAGGVSEEDLVTLGVLTAGDVLTEKASSPVCAPSGDVYLVEAKGFEFVVPENPPADCNGVAIVVGDGVEDDLLLGCQMALKCMSSDSETLTSEPLVSVQEVAEGRRCLFYFTETIPSAAQYGIRIYKNGGNELMPFLCGASQSGYSKVSWYDSVKDWNDTMLGSSWVYPALAWEVLKKEKSYSPAVDAVPTEGSSNPVSSGGVYNALASPVVDAVPTEGSALPVSSGGVFSALAQLAGGDGGSLKQPETLEECEWVLIWQKVIMGGDDSFPWVSADSGIDWATLTSMINGNGGICLPLGEYALLCKRPPDWTWNCQDMSLFFTCISNQAGLDVEIRYYYFNFPGIDS